MAPSKTQKFILKAKSSTTIENKTVVDDAFAVSSRVKKSNSLSFEGIISAMPSDKVKELIDYFEKDKDP